MEKKYSKRKKFKVILKSREKDPELKMDMRWDLPITRIAELITYLEAFKPSVRKK